MSRLSWSPEERAEFDAMMSEAIASSPNTSARADRFIELLEDAVQAQRFWAMDTERSCMRRGVLAELRAHADRQRAAVSHDGRILSLPRVQSRARKDETGQVYYQRALIEMWSWADIERKRSEAYTMRAQMGAEIAYYDKLLALRERCPTAESPADAARMLGFAIDDYLLTDEDAA